MEQQGIAFTGLFTLADIGSWCIHKSCLHFLAFS